MDYLSQEAETAISKKSQKGRQGNSFQRLEGGLKLDAMFSQWFSRRFQLSPRGFIYAVKNAIISFVVRVPMNLLELFWRSLKCTQSRRK